MTLQDAMLAVLRHAGRRPSTQKAYCREVRRFLAWLGHDRPLRALRSDVVRYLDEVGGRTVYGRRMAHAGLRFFFVHAVNQPGMMAGIPWPRHGRSLRKAPPWSDVEKLLRAIADPVCRAAACVIASAGLRVSEVCALHVEDVQTQRDRRGRALDHGVLLVRHGKGDKERLAPLTPALVRALRRYYRRIRPQDHLFPGAGPSQRLTPRRLRKQLREAGQRCGVTHHRPHELRHAFATTMLERGVDLATLQAAMGHQRLSSTSVYLHIRRDKLAAMPDLLAQR